MFYTRARTGVSELRTEEQAGLTRIVALRPCGHVAAFRSVPELLQGQARCPLCGPPQEPSEDEPLEGEQRQAGAYAGHPQWEIPGVPR